MVKWEKFATIRANSMAVQRFISDTMLSNHGEAHSAGWRLGRMRIGALAALDM